MKDEVKVKVRVRREREEIEEVKVNVGVIRESESQSGSEKRGNSHSIRGKARREDSVKSSKRMEKNLKETR